MRTLHPLLKKIIMNPYFKKKVIWRSQKAQMEDRFLRGRQIAFMIYEYLRVAGDHEAVLDYFQRNEAIVEAVLKRARSTEASVADSM